MNPSGLRYLAFKTPHHKQSFLNSKPYLQGLGYQKLSRSDNGPQFRSTEFAELAQNYDFIHSTTSPHFPQANGVAENGVKQAKRILDQPDPFVALMEHRASPTTVTGYSPCQLLQGRIMKATLPVPVYKLKPKWPAQQQVQSNHENAKKNQAQNFNRAHGAKNHQPYTI